VASALLICGPVGAGKTTVSRRLARERRAVAFAIDDWMTTLFGADAPAAPNLAWALERTARCEAQLWKVARALLGLGVDVVLDLGFLRREHRDRFRRQVKEAGFAAELHVVTADAATRRDRVRARNQALEGAASVEVSDAMFDWSEGWFEPPDAEELRVAVVHGGQAEERP
jgi:predicted kinase